MTFSSGERGTRKSHSLLYGNVGIFETFDNGRSVSLHGVVVDVHRGEHSIERHIATTRTHNSLSGAIAHRIFLSGLSRNRPSMLMASTRRPLSLCMSIIVSTVSYSMALPTFFDDSVFVATCACCVYSCALAKHYKPAPECHSSSRMLLCRRVREGVVDVGV